MDIELISKGIEIVSSTISSIKTIKDLLPSAKQKQDIEKQLEEAESNLKIAEAEIAKGFEYKLCRRHFPPGIMLDLNQFKLQCKTCGNIEDYE